MPISSKSIRFFSYTSFYIQKSCIRLYTDYIKTSVIFITLKFKTLLHFCWLCLKQYKINYYNSEIWLNNTYYIIY